MNLVDAARRLAANPLQDYDSNGDHVAAYCVICQSFVGHTESCPVPMLPQIVAVLEAAERVAADWLDGATDELGCIPVFVGDMEALRAALRGDGGRE